jgi:hypothetical protein
MDIPDIDPDLLDIFPPVLIQVVRALGIVRAREVLLEFGGGNVWVGKHRSRSMRLSAEELARMREYLAGHLDHTGRLYLPKADKLVNYARDEQIRREMFRKSIKQQSREYKLCNRQIMNIRAGERDDVSTEQKSRKSLLLSDDELSALTTLAKTQLEQTHYNPVLVRVLNKLDRARVANRATGVKSAQFDLFG